jgi:hypothetical protein
MMQNRYRDPARARADPELAAVTDLAYTADGLMKQYTGPANVNGQRATLDVAVPPPPTFGGPTAQTFSYDDLDRLVAAAGPMSNDVRLTCASTGP